MLNFLKGGATIRTSQGVKSKPVTQPSLRTPPPGSNVLSGAFDPQGRRMALEKGPRIGPVYGTPRIPQISPNAARAQAASAVPAAAPVAETMPVRPSMPGATEALHRAAIQRVRPDMRSAVAGRR